MSAPKSVVKTTVSKGRVICTYTSFLDQSQYYLFELNRAALRDVGIFLKKKFKAEFYTAFKKRTGTAGKTTMYKVWSSRNTKYPKLQIGLTNQKVEGFYAYFQEVGTSKTPKLAILQNAVKNNVDEIIKIESQYLSSLSDKVMPEIDESDYEDEEWNERMT